MIKKGTKEAESTVSFFFYVYIRLQTVTDYDIYPSFVI